MTATTVDTPVRTLASILPGEQLRIRRIIFDTVRARCDWSGLREGSVVACLAATTHHVLLRRADGRTVAVERWWAGFVEAETHDDPVPADAARCA
jgi:hypothetical protein